MRHVVVELLDAELFYLFIVVLSNLDFHLLI